MKGPSAPVPSLSTPEVLRSAVTYRRLCDVRDEGRRELASQQTLALPSACLHAASMPNILVRDLPDDVHGALQQRAEQQGQSLQQYLTNELTRLVERPTPEELFARVARRQGGKVGLEQAVADLEGERPAS